MLRFGFVLLVAASAFAAPSIGNYETLTTNSVYLSDVGTAPNVGGNNHILDLIFTAVDGGDKSVNVLTAESIINNLGAKRDRSSQVFALGEAIGSILAQSTGVSGDACRSAAIINSVGSVNERRELVTFVKHISKLLGLIVNLIRNPESTRYAVGPTTGCPASGREYALEPAWDHILASASNNNYGLLNEQYCSVKRLYKALDARNNIAGAAITALSLPSVQKVLTYAYDPLINLLSIAAYKGNTSAALPAAQRALIQALNHV